MQVVNATALYDEGLFLFLITEQITIPGFKLSCYTSVVLLQ